MAMPRSSRVKRYFAAKQHSTALNPNYVYNNFSNGSKCNSFRTSRLLNNSRR